MVQTRGNLQYIDKDTLPNFRAAGLTTTFNISAKDTIEVGNEDSQVPKDQYKWSQQRLYEPG